MACCGFDAGTYNLVSCYRNDKNDFVYRREVNAFLEISLEHQFVFNMMKKAGVPLIKRQDTNVAYALGEAAIEMAYTMPQIELRRPMKDGCVNPKESNAFQIMSVMIHSLIGNVVDDKTVLYYSVPANAINEETDAEFHGKLLDAIFKAYRSDKGYTVVPFPINEALALVYAELAHKNFTGIGVSCGAGQINVNFSIFAAPVFSFSIVNSGDWIDKMAAKASAESVAFINKEKTKIDLGVEPKTLVERAIQTQYRLMIEKTVSQIKRGLETNHKAHTADPIDVIVAGGTSSPPGFDKMFREVLMQAELPIKVGEVVRPIDPLYCVARGALLAAENHS